MYFTPFCSPFTSELPLENRAPFGRLLCWRFGFCKDIDFMPEGLYFLSIFDNDFFEKSFVKVMFPGSHQFISCFILISGRNFVNVHDSKEWHVSSFLFLFFVPCCAKAAL